MTLDHLAPATVLALFAARTAELRLRRGRVGGVVLHRWSFHALFLSGTAVVLLGLADWWLGRRGFSALRYAAGLSAGLGSFALRHWAARALGDFWSVQVEIRSRHPVISTGPYARLAHPIYTAACLELAGVILVLGSLWAAAGFVVLFLPALLARIRVEESAMLSACGRHYADYLASTSRLIPWVF